MDKNKHSINIQKVITLKEKNYLTTDVVKNGKFAEKSIYSITNKGIEYFQELMEKYSEQEITIPINFNVVISNLNKMSKPKALELINKIRDNIIKAQGNNKKIYRIVFGYSADRQNYI